MIAEEGTNRLQQYRVCVTALLLCVPVALIWATLYSLRLDPHYLDIAVELLTAFLVLIVYSKVWGLGIRPLQVGGGLFLLGIYMDALHDFFLAPEYVDVFVCQILQLAGVTLFAWSTYYYHSQLKQQVAWLRNDLKEMEYQATHDPLTELPNRILFHDRLLQALAGARRRQQQLAVLYIDLDNMKRVNDTFGHSTGDELLKTIAGRLQALIRGCDTIARLSGDEFAVIQTDVKQPEDPKTWPINYCRLSTNLLTARANQCRPVPASASVFTRFIQPPPTIC